MHEEIECKALSSAEFVREWVCTMRDAALPENKNCVFYLSHCRRLSAARLSPSRQMANGRYRRTRKRKSLTNDDDDTQVPPLTFSLCIRARSSFFCLRLIFMTIIFFSWAYIPLCGCCCYCRCHCCRRRRRHRYYYPCALFPFAGELHAGMNCPSTRSHLVCPPSVIRRRSSAVSFVCWSMRKNLFLKNKCGRLTGQFGTIVALYACVWV